MTQPTSNLGRVVAEYAFQNGCLKPILPDLADLEGVEGVTRGNFTRLRIEIFHFNFFQSISYRPETPLITPSTPSWHRLDNFARLDRREREAAFAPDPRGPEAPLQGAQRSVQTVGRIRLTEMLLTDHLRGLQAGPSVLAVFASSSLPFFPCRHGDRTSPATQPFSSRALSGEMTGDAMPSCACALQTLQECIPRTSNFRSSPLSARPETVLRANGTFSFRSAPFFDRLHRFWSSRDICGFRPDQLRQAPISNLGSWSGLSWGCFINGIRIPQKTLYCTAYFHPFTARSLQIPAVNNPRKTNTPPDQKANTAGGHNYKG
jgi:hypothetical protein